MHSFLWKSKSRPAPDHMLQVDEVLAELEGRDGTTKPPPLPPRNPPSSHSVGENKDPGKPPSGRTMTSSRSMRGGTPRPESCGPVSENTPQPEPCSPESTHCPEPRSSLPQPSEMVTSPLMHKVRGIWCENCNSRLVELKKQAVKLWMPYAMHRDSMQIKVGFCS